MTLYVHTITVQRNPKEERKVFNYTIKRGYDSVQRSHGGDKTIRHFTLFVDGVEYETFREDSQQVNYNSDKYFDRYLKNYVEKLMKFFPGTLTYTSVGNPANNPENRSPK